MALTSAEKMQAKRSRDSKREAHIAAAKKIVPTAGPRQDRAVDHALWHMEAHERGEIDSPYPMICFDGPALPVGSGVSDEKRVKEKKG